MECHLMSFLNDSLRPTHGGILQQVVLTSHNSLVQRFDPYLKEFTPRVWQGARFLREAISLL